MSTDHGQAADRLGIQVTRAVEQRYGRFAHEAYGEFSESGRERTSLLVRKWDADQVAWARRRLDLGPAEPRQHDFLTARLAPYETFEYYGNLITWAGWAALIAGGMFGTTPTKFSTTAGRIGVGTGTTAAAGGDTALISIGAMANHNWVLAASNPTVTTSSTPCTFVLASSFPSLDANGAWQEFAVDIGTVSTLSTASVAPMYNHSTNIGAGTKSSGQVWTATATLSFT
jgi:hypothetical protein